jgi:glyoxylate reductase
VTAPPSSATAGAASRPSVHVAGPVPQRIQSELQESFELVDEPAGADGILSLLTTAVDGDYLDAAGPQLRVVANYGVGVDNVDLGAARKSNVLIANTPDVLTETTAELTIGLTLALLRRIAEGDRMLRARETWRFSLEFMLGESLRGKQFGVVGAGRIGKATARLAEAHGAIPVFNGRGDDLGALLHVADVVSLHCPLTPETHHLLDASAFERMKPTAVLVNTARGAIVDEASLVAALEAGTIAGAALDVYEHEPDVTPGLLQLENVVLTPHLGSATRATREDMGLLAVHALREVLLEQRRPSNTVV